MIIFQNNNDHLGMRANEQYLQEQIKEDYEAIKSKQIQTEMAPFVPYAKYITIIIGFLMCYLRISFKMMMPQYLSEILNIVPPFVTQKNLDTLLIKRYLLKSKLSNKKV